MDKTAVSNVWKKLTDHCRENSALQVKDQFVGSPSRFSEFSLQAANIFLDYSKNRITKITFDLLCELAEVTEVARYRDEMFGGKPINATEDRAVLHVALRDRGSTSTVDGGVVQHELQRIADCVHNIRGGRWYGYSGKEITDIVNIGIGGSDLGPAMVVAALKPYVTKINAHFVSNIDATHISETLRYLNPETTMFVIASKTFTTQETLMNAMTAKEWLLSKTRNKKNVIDLHFLAVTANPERAVDFGISCDNVFPFWDWVGGRFSLWSAIGLPIALAVGMEKFYELLDGAHAMDEHFKRAPLSANMPVILALLSVWNNNFLGADTQAIIPYDQYLSLFPAYLQQLEMESNGKRVCMDGGGVKYKTAPVVWGGVGSNSQHSFHQLLMQGTRMVPVDFIVSLHSHNAIGEHHRLLYANCVAQSQALMCGRAEDEVVAELRSQGLAEDLVNKLAPHKVVPGNIPSNTLVMKKLEPSTLGALIALYEHKVFVQGVIWRINSFDQWGVELGKHLANNLVPMLKGDADVVGLDGSTCGLINMMLRDSLE